MLLITGHNGNGDLVQKVNFFFFFEKRGVSNLAELNSSFFCCSKVKSKNKSRDDLFIVQVLTAKGIHMVHMVLSQ